MMVWARLWSAHGATLLGLACLHGCGAETPRQETLLVFAAASLTESFEAVGAAFEAVHPRVDVQLHFAGTPRLVLQIREGAPVDVFASADEPNMERVVATGRVLAAPQRFATNRLTIVTAPGNPKGIGGLADLGRDDVAVVLCGPEVPAGRYARRALAAAGMEVGSLSDEPSVKAVVQRVALGEVDAGIVYVTDATSAHGRVDAVEIPAAHNVVGRYPVALLGAGEPRPAAARFVAFLTADTGRSILDRFGFGAP